MSAFIPFKIRIAQWSEAKILVELDVRSTKLSHVGNANNPSMLRRLLTEKNSLGARLVELRNLSLPFPDKGGSQGSTPPTENAPEEPLDPTKPVWKVVLDQNL